MSLDISAPEIGQSAHLWHFSRGDLLQSEDEDAGDDDTEDDSFQKMYNTYMHPDVQKEKNWDNVKKIVILQGNFIKIFML